VAGRVAGTRPNDATRVAVMLARRYGATLVRLLNRTAAGRHLARVGLSADIAFCAKRDIHSAVPRYHERRITL
jgi:phosphosulfolactate phosphohydrolase-like enzyme